MHHCLRKLADAAPPWEAPRFPRVLELRCFCCSCGLKFELPLSPLQNHKALPVALIKPHLASHVLAGMRPAAEHTYRLIDNKHCPTHMALSLASNHPRVLCQHDFLVAQQPRTSMAQVHLITPCHHHSTYTCLYLFQRCYTYSRCMCQHRNYVLLFDDVFGCFCILLCYASSAGHERNGKPAITPSLCVLCVASFPFAVRVCVRFE